MSYCLNPSCSQPLNPDHTAVCQSCGTPLVLRLRNRYRIIRPMGSGGFGRTFLAEDEDKLNEPCVVKQFVPHTQAENTFSKAMHLFQEEARRLQQLGEHPQIPTLYAYFEDGHYLYLVQQLIIGLTLRQELEQHGKFSEAKIWDLLHDLLPVLKFIHQHQVIHRDIKPENIMRRRSDGRAVLIDFGIAKQVTATAITKPGTSIGSHGYASLEQMTDGKAYPASDLYSLGVTCFFLLTGMHPSRLWAEHGYNWVTHWREYLGTQTINQDLDQILDRLLQKNLDRRYHFVDEVLEDITQKCPQCPLSPTQFPDTQFPDHLADTVAATALRSNHAAPPEPQVAPLPQPQPPSVPRVTPRRHLLPWLCGGCAGLLLLGFFGYQFLQGQGRPSLLVGHTDEVNTIAFTPDGQKFVSGSDDRTIKIWDLQTRKALRTLQGHTDWVYSVAISLDGQTIVSGSKDHTLKVWDLPTGQLRQTLQEHWGYVNSVAFSSDKHTIASGSYDKTNKLWDLKTGKVKTLVGHSREVLAVAVSPDTRKFVSSSGDRTLIVWDIKTGQKLRILQGHTGDVNAIAFSPNGQLLASVSDDKTLKIWDFNRGDEIRTFTGHTGDINAVVFHPDGQRVMTGSDDRTIKLWNIVTGEQLQTLRGHTQPIFGLAISPDGQTLVSASGDKTIKVWHIAK